MTDAGETQFFLPGVTPDLERDLEGYYRARYNLNDDDDDGDDENPEYVHQQHPPPTVNPSIERFKYTVISSSLLSSSLSTHHHTSNRTSKSFVIPGRLQHSRDTTVEEDSSSLPVQPAFPPLGSKSATTGTATTTAMDSRPPYGHGQGQEDQDQDVPSPTNPRSSQAQATQNGPETTYGPAAILGSISVLFVGCGYPSLAVLFYIITVYLVYWSPLLGDGKIEIVGRHDMELVSFHNLDVYNN